MDKEGVINVDETFKLLDQMSQLDKFIKSVSDTTKSTSLQEENMVEKPTVFPFGSIMINPINNEYDGRSNAGFVLCDIYKDSPSEWFWNSKDRYSGYGDDYIKEDLFELFEDIEKVPAPFGNLGKKQTEVDIEVRNCSQIDLSGYRETDIICKLCNEIRDKWLSVTGHLVDVQADKALFYPVGGHFKEHVDTPKPGLIGTTIFQVEGEFEVFKVNDKTWTGDKGDFCSFFSDSIHEILPTKRERIVVTFKIYSKSQKVTDETEQLIQKLTGRFSRHTSKFGILLKHGYSYSDLNMKGIDSILLQALHSIGYKTELIPVLVKNNICYYDDVGDELYIYSYNERQKPIPFYMNGRGKHYKNLSGTFYIGNEYANGEEHYYFNKAIICTPKKQVR